MPNPHADTPHAEIADIADDLGSLATVSEGRDLDALIVLVDAYFRHPDAGAHLELWFHFFERFPDADGFGTFEAIMHRIEGYPHHAFVVESVRRCPARMPVAMLNRMLNAGIRRVAGADLLGLLERVAQSTDCARGVREDAAHFHAYQRTRP